MSSTIRGLKVAVLATDGVEQVELTSPVQALREAGADVTVVSLTVDSIQGMNHDQKGDKLPVDQALSNAVPSEFDALLLPGGVQNPDTLRTKPAAVAFAKHFTDAGKPVASICHGPWTLIEADAVRGKRMTSWPSLQTDLRNAGAEWVDEACVVDGPLVTSRKPDDLPMFNEHMVRVFSSGVSRSVGG